MNRADENVHITPACTRFAAIPRTGDTIRSITAMKMIKARILALSIVVGLLGCSLSVPHPDVTRADPIHWPQGNDLERMKSVEGHGKHFVLETLGHPKQVTMEDGVEVWTYPWLAVMTVTFSNDLVVSTFYTAGY